MAAPRKPSRILSLEGRFRHNPARGRARANEPIKNARLGDPPIRLSEGRQAVWREILGLLVPGVALQSDAIAFEEMVCLVARTREQWLEPKDRAQLIRLFTLFGMTPADRSRVSVDRGAKDQNPFEKIG